MFHIRSYCACVIVSSFISGAFLLESREAHAETIKLISSSPRTGSANAQTTSMVNGIKLAIEEVQSKVAGLDVVYEDWNDASPERGSWDPAVEAANADKAINDPDIMAYLGTYNSGAAKISMPKLNRAGLAMVSPGNTWPGLTKSGFGEASEPMVYRPSGRVTYFRVIPTDDLQGPAGATWAQSMGVKKAFVLHDRELYGQGVATLFKKAAVEKGIDVAGFEGIDPKASNYRSLGIKIRQTGAELLYFGGTTQTNAGQIIKDIRAVGLKDLKVMVPDGCFELSFITSAGAENVNGRTFITFGGVPADQLTGQGQLFRQSYKTRFGIEPESYAVYGYETARVTLDAIKRAGKKDREAIIEALKSTKGFSGALGNWDFDNNGDTSLKVMSGNGVINGNFSFIKLIQ